MKKLAVVALITGLALIGSSLIAHPHFDKSVVVKLPTGQQLTVAYNTTPANEMQATNAPVGAFVTPRAPQLTVSGELKAGSVTVPAGQYTIGVIKVNANDWTMALFPGKPTGPRGSVAAADMGKVIKLESMFNASAGVADHMLIDITPGHGKFEEKAVLTLHFGKLFLSGLIG